MRTDTRKRNAHRDYELSLMRWIEDCYCDSYPNPYRATTKRATS